MLIRPGAGTSRWARAEVAGQQDVSQRQKEAHRTVSQTAWAARARPKKSVGWSGRSAHSTAQASVEHLVDVVLCDAVAVELRAVEQELFLALGAPALVLVEEALDVALVHDLGKARDAGLDV